VQPLKIAIGNYGITRALKDGNVRGPALQHIEVSPITAAMRRMVRTLEFDVCEMAFTTYLCAKALGKPIVAIPAFVTSAPRRPASAARGSPFLYRTR